MTSVARFPRSLFRRRHCDVQRGTRGGDNSAQMARWVQPTGEPLALNAVSGFTTRLLAPCGRRSTRLVRWRGWHRWLGGGFVLIEFLAPLPPREPYGWRRNKGRVQLVCKKLGSGRALDE